MSKIKVLHVFQQMSRGGAETMIMNIYRKIDREKIQFDFLCMSPQKGDYDEEIKKLGGNIYIIPSPKERGPINHIKDIVKVIKEHGGYDARHIPTMFHSGIVCFAAYIAHVKKRIVHSHNANEFNDNTLKRKIYRGISRVLIKLFCTDRVACGIKAREYLFGKSKKVEKNTLLVNNGIELEEYKNINKDMLEEKINELGLSKTELIIGNVARFEEQKNHVFFLKLAHYLKDKNINAKIVLVGDGKLREEIQNRTIQEEIDKYFVFTGKRKDIPYIMSIFDVFVMPSLYEGFPLTIVEALAAGKNCVISDTISIEVEVIDGTISFVNLNDRIEKWYDLIINAKQKRTDKLSNIKKLEESGYSAKSSMESLVRLYMK